MKIESISIGRFHTLDYVVKSTSAYSFIYGLTCAARLSQDSFPFLSNKCVLLQNYFLVFGISSSATVLVTSTAVHLIL